MKIKEEKSETYRRNARNRWDKSKKNATAYQLDSNSKASKVKESKVKEKKIKEIKKVNIAPTFLEFENYIRSKKYKDFEGKKQSLKIKYDAWIENGWKDGYDKPIKNWKSKILNTYPHLKVDFTKVETKTNSKYFHDTDAVMEVYKNSKLKNLGNG